MPALRISRNMFFTRCRSRVTVAVNICLVFMHLNALDVGVERCMIILLNYMSVTSFVLFVPACPFYISVV